MADINVEIVKEFFEAQNFLVRVNRKYALTSMEKSVFEEIDLLVSNMNPETGPPPEGVLLSGADIRSIRRGIVGVKGWHTETFSPSSLVSSPTIFSSVSPRAIRWAEDHFAGVPFRKILVVPSLPKTKAVREKSLGIIASRGLDHVLEFPQILQTLMDKVEVNRNYTESDILQLLRILKNYRLLRDPQLELFAAKRKRRRKKTPKGGERGTKDE